MRHFKKKKKNCNWSISIIIITTIIPLLSPNRCVWVERWNIRILPVLMVFSFTISFWKKKPYLSWRPKNRFCILWNCCTLNYDDINSPQQVLTSRVVMASRTYWSSGRCRCQSSSTSGNLIRVCGNLWVISELSL